MQRLFSLRDGIIKAMKNILLVFCLVSAKLCAQNYSNNINTITTAVSFLRISPDARAAGMGDGSIALCNDANSMNWNISKLAFAEHRFGMSASYTPWMRSLVPDINLLYASAYFKPDSVSAIGISARYFRMGTITYTNSTGTVIGQFKPYEYAVDIGYARQLFCGFSVGLAFRYIFSDLTNGVTIAGVSTHAGESYAGDLGISWMSGTKQYDHWQGKLISGLALTNVGSKIAYDTLTENFIPINLGIAQGIELDYQTKHHFEFQLQFDKLLVPSPPIYEIDSITGAPKTVNGQYVVLAGKDPDRSVWKGMTGSFNDAPGGRTEELREINISVGAEYVYDETFKVRTGYFHEHETKGNRKYVTLGAGVTFTAFSLDFSYLLPVNRQRSPLDKTLRFTLMFNIDKLKIQPRPHRFK